MRPDPCRPVRARRAPPRPVRQPHRHDVGGGTGPARCRPPLAGIDGVPVRGRRLGRSPAGRGPGDPSRTPRHRADGSAPGRVAPARPSMLGQLGALALEIARAARALRRGLRQLAEGVPPVGARRAPDWTPPDLAPARHSRRRTFRLCPAHPAGATRQSLRGTGDRALGGRRARLRRGRRAPVADPDRPERPRPRPRSAPAPKRCGPNSVCRPGSSSAYSAVSRPGRGRTW